MAELDTMNVIDVGRGVEPASRNAELSAINTGLNLTSKIIDEKVRGDLRSDLTEAQESVVAAANAPEVQPTFETLTDDDDSEFVVNFASQMQKHSAIVAQAKDGNLRTRAMLLMQQELIEAKRTHRWMAAELDQEASRFMSNNPVLTQLAMDDSRINAARTSDTSSQDWIDGVTKKAHGSLASGGLQMDPSIEFGTVTFAREYGAGMERQQKIVTLQEEEAFYAATDVKDVRVAGELASRELNGPEGGYALFMDSMTFEMKDILQDKADFMNGNLDESTYLRNVDAFNSVHLPIIEQNVVRAIAAMDDKYNALFPGNLADEPLAKAWRERVNSQQQDLRLIIDVAKSGNYDIMEIVEAQSRIRSQRRLDQAPVFQDIVDLSSLGPDFLKLYENLDLTFQGTYDMHSLSEGVGRDLKRSMFPSMVGSWLDSGGATDPAERLANRDGAFYRTDAQGGRVITNDPKLAIQDAIGQAENLTEKLLIQETYAPMDDVLTANDITGSMYRASKLVNAQTGEKDLLRKERDTIRNLLIQPKLIDLAKRAGRDSPEVREMAKVVNDVYLSEIDPPAQWSNEIIEIAQQSMNKRKASNPDNITLMELIDIDDSKFIENGHLQFSVNDAAVRSILPWGKETDGALFGFGDTQAESNAKTEDEIRKKVIEFAEQLTTEVSEYSRMLAFANWVKNPALDEPEYAVALSNGVDGSLTLLDMFIKNVDDFDGLR